ncbi:mannose-P-dolichol utilization defect 1 protein-like [Thunnus albacares]|uniref:mannose-P-dolichol utilization defect 1 protein-like n=1 Tax=Thunnus maccoyii TaxID=8240 RepID=UPI001C4BB671|nr:mannose-P-dolichol utilization defect 1 protein-like [Thunnus maccoyii]XP_044226232.1 mannose-P-dolichol utilization defect 1 protein-like [Thunnus albacares]
MATSPVKEFLVTHLMPAKCYEELFVNFHFHVPCIKFVLNKTAGFWILLDTFLAQLLQLLKILWRGSAEGLSLPSVLLQLYAFSCPVVYAVANSFPLFAWGERLFTLAQTAVIVFLILRYRGETLKGVLFLLTYSGLMFLLGSYTAAAVISVMQPSALAALIASKVLQAGTNYCNGHTGQLSTLSVFLSCAGSLGLLFVSLQEEGGSLTTLSHTLSACLGCVLLAQVLCYKSSSKKKTE